MGTSITQPQAQISILASYIETQIVLANTLFPAPNIGVSGAGLGVWGAGHGELAQDLE